MIKYAVNEASGIRLGTQVWKGAGREGSLDRLTKSWSWSEMPGWEEARNLKIRGRYLRAWNNLPLQVGHNDFEDEKETNAG